eukprot:374193-Heterocapsa_arctica.AAC.1
MSPPIAWSFRAPLPLAPPESLGSTSSDTASAVLMLVVVPPTPACATAVWVGGPPSWCRGMHGLFLAVALHCVLR